MPDLSPVAPSRGPGRKETCVAKTVRWAKRETRGIRYTVRVKGIFGAHYRERKQPTIVADGVDRNYSFQYDTANKSCIGFLCR